MPTIRPSAECNDISNEYGDYGFITKSGKSELYELLNEGLQAERAGETKTLNDVINDIREGSSDV